MIKYLSHYLPYNVQNEHGEFLQGIEWEDGNGKTQCWQASFHTGNYIPVDSVKLQLWPFSALVTERPALEVYCQHCESPQPYRLKMDGLVCNTCNGVIQHNPGRQPTIIPAIEIAKLATDLPDLDWKARYHKDESRGVEYVQVEAEKFNKKVPSAIYRIDMHNPNYWDVGVTVNPDHEEEATEETGNQIEIFQKLLEWNFDIFSLIQQDLAVAYE